ncbi:MAG: hypothetical protein WAM44_04525 [Chthoniobacterales bacterium]
MLGHLIEGKPSEFLKDWRFLLVELPRAGFCDPPLDLPEPDRFGVIYFGSSLRLCFFERVLRDRRNGRLGDLPMPFAEFEQLTCAEITTARQLNLVDLRSDCLVK